MKDLHRFLGELRSRGVLRSVTLYLAAAWAAIEVADTVFPRVGIPDAFVTLVVWLAVAAFPVAAVLSWVFSLESGRIHRSAAASASLTRRLAIVLVALTGVLGMAAWSVWLKRPAARNTQLDESLVAVLPFRIEGASGDLAYLHEGLVDLLAVKLTGDVGPRAVDPRAVVSAWRRASSTAGTELTEAGALAVARTTGAARAIIGSVVGSAAVMTISANLIDVAGARRQVATVVGPADSLPVLVDRLAAMLLSLQSGIQAQELEPLVVTPLPALRHYLLGEAAYRRGDFRAAVGSYRQAMEIDSTFAMAAFGVERAAPWVGLEELRLRARDIAWRHRDKLTRLDRTHLIGRAGPAHPAHPTARELLDARRAAVELMPERAEVWYELGDLYFHWGWLIGESDVFGKAMEGFKRALALDPEFAAPLQHSVLALTVLGDTAGLSRLGELLRSSSEVAAFARWHRAVAAADTTGVRSFLASLDGLSLGTLMQISQATQDHGYPPRYAGRALSIRRSRPATPDERQTHLLQAYATALNAGRPEEAGRMLDEYAAGTADGHHVHREAVLHALYAGGDTVRAIAAVHSLESAAVTDVLDGLENRCVAAQWKLWMGERLDDATLPARSLAAAGAGRGLRNSMLRVCAGIVQALAAPTEAARKMAVDSLEAFLLTGPFTGLVDYGYPYYGNLAIARLFQLAGEPRRALAAARRRIHFLGYHPYAAAAHLMEARLSARAGLVDDAIAAYVRYLNLRENPEPSRRPEADEAHKELAELRSS